VVAVIKHGHTRGYSTSPTYNSWKGMVQRCANATSSDFSRYGGRGIAVCRRWLRFENFLRDMGERPKGTTLDRKCNSGNYCKSNCRWVTQLEQANNRRDNTYLTVGGTRMSIADWGRKYGLRKSVISQRLLHGWSIKAAVTTPSRGYKCSTRRLV